MSSLKYKIRGSVSPQGKPRVYFCCHHDDFNNFFDKISNDILSNQNCAVWYRDDYSPLDDDLKNDLKQMQLFVIPVTAKFLTTENEAFATEFKIAAENHIPILPLMQEPGLEKLFNYKCGNLQFLNKYSNDATEISYDEKLKKYLESILVGDKLADKIRAAFDAYVFLSYRKKDRKYAQELMKLIHRNNFCRDIAIWYDEFLTPGENFNDSIREALVKSDLFVLTVTPNLVNELNYIVTTEYPMAKRENKPVLPVELVPTDKDKLFDNFKDISSPVNAYDDEIFNDALLSEIRKLAISESQDSPEHNFFIGLAYLNGIDVEVDRERAVSLITSAAQDGLFEAMAKLYNMYADGEGVPVDYSESEYWAEKSYADCLQALGEEHPDTLYWMNNLSIAHGNAGNYEKQLELTQKCYELHKKVYGEEHMETLTLLSNLAIAYGELGNHENALREQQKTLNRELRFYTTLSHTDDVAINDPSENLKKKNELTEKCYELRKKVLGEEHIHTLSTLKSLINIYLDTYDNKKKLELTEKSYNLHKKIFGEEHPDTIDALYSYTSVHEGIMYRGKHEKLHELQDKLLELRKKQYDAAIKLYGEDHLHTLDMLDALANTYRIVGYHDKHRELIEIYYNKRRKIFGEYHSSLLYPLSILANSLNSYEKKIAAREKIYEINRKYYGETHDNTMLALNNLAVICNWAKDVQGELRSRKKMYEVHRDNFGEENPITLSYMHALGIAYVNTNNDEAALDITQKCYNLRRKVLGENHFDTIFSLRDLADVYNKVGDKSHELEARIKLYEISRETSGEESKNTIDFLTNLAFLYEELNDSENTFKCMEKIYNINKKIYVEHDARAIVSLNNLATAYGGIGNYKKAIELYEKSNELCSFESRPETLDTVTLFRNIANAYLQTDDVEDASEFYKKAFELCKSLYESYVESCGEKEHYALTLLYNLALCYGSCGDSDMQIKLFEKCYELSKEVFGDTDPSTLKVLSDLNDARRK